MAAMRKILISTGIAWVEVPEADVRVLCGAPPDAVKHLFKKGLIQSIETDGVPSETGPNAILLSDLQIQNGRVCNRAEFPVLQMLYRQGLLLPGHPRNTGVLPQLIGRRAVVDAQMAYILRGNYGLLSEDELRAAGATPELAHEVMRMKLAFAFGHIRPTEELLEPVYVENDAVPLRSGVTVRRLRTNVFEFAYRDEHVEVDLNLKPGEIYECPYTLGSHLLRREYFAIVHTGDGDGWDVNRPAMGSIVLYQGRIYLVDAGPNIERALIALGIGVNEIDGIFHTHGHDDHLLGLMSLIQRDRPIPYFAVPMVADSVFRKVSAATQIHEEDLRALFDIRPLALDTWNDIEGLEVMPVLSPHPVETTIMRFRTLWSGGYKSYAHLADIASFEVMRGMLAADRSEHGISPARYEATCSAYLEPADVKKVDIGGGLIHGNAEDFRGDRSGKLILAHTARGLTDAERSIGSGAPFGTVDVLIEERSDVLRRHAFAYLREYFPGVPMHRMRQLMNGDVEVFNPESLLVREGDRFACAYLVLSGSVEMLHRGYSGSYVVSAGSIIGETEALLDLPAAESYRALGFVQVLRMPRDVYHAVIRQSGLYDRIVAAHETHEFLRSSQLFSDGISRATLVRLIGVAARAVVEAGASMPPPEQSLILIRDGVAELSTPSGYRETLGARLHFGATSLSRGVHQGAQVRVRERLSTYAIPIDDLRGIPVVRWKLLETHRRRYGMAAPPR